MNGSSVSLRILSGWRVLGEVRVDLVLAMPDMVAKAGFPGVGDSSTPHCVFADRADHMRVVVSGSGG